MKKSRKFLSVLCALIIVFSYAAFAYAEDDMGVTRPKDIFGITEVAPLPSSPELANFEEQIQDMTDVELNVLIHDLSIQATQSNDAQSTRGVIQLAWIAAAKLVQGTYPCAGTLVEYSALGTDYLETNGIFAAPIKATRAYRTWTTSLAPSAIEFTKSENSDLFYSLHLANIRLGGSSSQGSIIVVTDVFDFEFSTDMGDMFSTLVNDWAWLSQNIGALTPIDVTITFNG